MKNTRRLLIVAYVALSISAHAGNEKGNGGDALVCYDRAGNWISTEFFDRFETERIYHRSIDLGGKNLTPIEKIQLVKSRNSSFLPNLMTELSDHGSTFESRILFSDSPLEDIPDTGDAVLPQGCQIKQAIIRTRTLHVTGKYYLVDSKLWNQMDSDSKAAAIMHEFFYGRAVDQFGQTNSRLARYLNSFFLGAPPARPFMDWLVIFSDAKQTLAEAWANSSSRVNPDGFVLTNVSAPFRIESDNFGWVSLLPAPENLILKYQGKLPTILKGNIGEERRFSNASASILFKGQFDLGNSSSSPRLSGATTVENISNPDGSVAFRDSCVSDHSTAWLGSGNGKDDSHPLGDRIDLQSPDSLCAPISARFSPLEAEISAKTVSEVGLGAGYFHLNVNGAGQLLWKYGNYNTNGLRLTVDHNGKTLQADSRQRKPIGVWPRLEVAGSTLNDLEFSGIQASLVGPRFEYFSLTDSTQILNFRTDLRLQARCSDISNNFENTYIVKTSDKTDGCDSSLNFLKFGKYTSFFLSPVAQVSVNGEKSITQIGVEYRTFPRVEDSAGYIQRVRKKIDGRWQDVSLNEAFHQLDEIHTVNFRSDSQIIELEKDQCFTFVSKYNENISMTLTRAGRDIFRNPNIEKSSGLYIEACFKGEQLVVSKIWTLELPEPASRSSVWPKRRK